jgi:hypothetical protein
MLKFKLRSLHKINKMSDVSRLMFKKLDWIGRFNWLDRESDLKLIQTPCENGKSTESEKKGKNR